MRYPCPLPPEEDETLSVAKRTSAVGRYGSESLPVVSVVEDSELGGLRDVSNQGENEDGQCSVESQLRDGLTTLRRVLASYECGNPLPDGSRALDNTLGRTSDGDGGDGRGREPPLLSQDFEPAQNNVSETNGSWGNADSEREDSLPPSDVAEGKTNMAASKRPSMTENSEINGDESCIALSKSASHSPAPLSASPQQSSGSVGRTSSSEGCRCPTPTPNKGNVSLEEAHSSCRSQADDLIAGPSEHAVEFGDEQKEHQGHLKDSDSMEGRDGAPGTSPAKKRPDETAGRVHRGTRVCAADLEAASKEGERLAGLAVKACEQLEKEEASLLR